MAPHSSTLAWKIPWTEGPGGLQSMGSLGVGHDWATSLYFFTFMQWRRKWQPTPVFLPGESQGWGSLVGCRLWGRRVWHDCGDLAAAAAITIKIVFIFVHIRNESPVQVWFRIQEAWGWCTGMTQRDGMGREVGGGFRMGNTCTPMADACWCMAKPI